MHPAQIKAGLEMAGYTQVDVAEQLGLARNTINYVVSGRGRSRVVENRIAVILGKSLHDLWPQWYSKDGKPIRTRRRPVRLGDTIARMAAAGASAKG